jgi:hypothetical protein
MPATLTLPATGKPEEDGSVVVLPVIMVSMGKAMLTFPATDKPEEDGSVIVFCVSMVSEGKATVLPS